MKEAIRWVEDYEEVDDDRLLIRCKDCKFSILNNGVYHGSETNRKCIAMGAVVNGDDYCAWAERK